MTANEKAKEFIGPVIAEALAKAGIELVWKHEIELLRFATACTNTDEVLLALEQIQEVYNAKKC